MLEFNKEDPTAIVVIDMQVDFVKPEGCLQAEGAMEIIPNIQKLLQLARDKKIPILFTKEMHRPGLDDYGIEGSFEPPHCLENGGAEEIIEELQPLESDFIISNKRRYDAMLGTDMDLLLRNLQIKNLIFVGVCTDICVISTIYHARNLDYKVCVLSDATAGSTQERHEAAFKVMEHCFARVMTLDEAIETFDL